MTHLPDMTKREKRERERERETHTDRERERERRGVSMQAWNIHTLIQIIAGGLNEHDQIGLICMWEKYENKSYHNKKPRHKHKHSQ